MQKFVSLSINDVIPYIKDKKSMYLLWTYKQRLGSTQLQCFAFGQFKTSPSLTEPAESSYIETVTPSSEAKEHPPRNGAGEVFV